jgi:hypothetical protein
MKAAWRCHESRNRKNIAAGASAIAGMALAAIIGRG